MSATVLYPRAAVSLRASVFDGSKDVEVQTSIVPNSVTVTRQPHNKASTCEVSISTIALPFEPRAIQGVFISVFYAALNSIDEEIVHERNLRFVGYCDDMESDRSAQGQMVTLRARDLSQMLREHKPLEVGATPRYSDSLTTAITRILESVVGAPEALKLRQTDALTQTSLGKLVQGKHSANAPVQLPRDVSAWEAIEQICGLCGLLVSVELGDIVVRFPTDAYSNTQKPKVTLTFGGDEANLLNVRMRRRFLKPRKGVKVVAIDPDSRTKIESTVNGVARLRPKPQKPAGTHSSQRRAAPRVQSLAEQNKDFDVYALRGAFTQDAVDAYAKRIFLERSRQDLDTSVSTPEWTDDILALRNGDRIRMRVTPDLEARIRATPDDAQAVALVQKAIGLNRDAAEVLVRCARNPQQELFYASVITDQWTSRGMASTKVEFVNLIEIDA